MANLAGLSRPIAVMLLGAEVGIVKVKDLLVHRHVTRTQI